MIVDPFAAGISGAVIAIGEQRSAGSTAYRRELMRD
jgi:hypothetical protein